MRERDGSKREWESVRKIERERERERARTDGHIKLIIN